MGQPGRYKKVPTSREAGQPTFSWSNHANAKRKRPDEDDSADMPPAMPPPMPTPMPTPIARPSTPPPRTAVLKALEAHTTPGSISRSPLGVPSPSKVNISPARLATGTISQRQGGSRAQPINIDDNDEDNAFEARCAAWGNDMTAFHAPAPLPASTVSSFLPSHPDPVGSQVDIEEAKCTKCDAVYHGPSRVERLRYHIQDKHSGGTRRWYRKKHGCEELSWSRRDTAASHCKTVHNLSRQETWQVVYEELVLTEESLNESKPSPSSNQTPIPPPKPIRKPAKPAQYDWVDPNDAHLVPVDIRERLNLPPAALDGRKPFKCPDKYCVNTGIAQSFTTRAALRIHWFEAHQGYRIRCSWPGCKKVFKDVGGQQRHIQTIHQGRRYTCPERGCEEVVYLSLPSLQLHKAVSHVGHWKYCSVEGCEDLHVFARELYLNDHVQRFHHHIPLLTENKGTLESEDSVSPDAQHQGVPPSQDQTLSPLSDSDPINIVDRYDDDFDDIEDVDLPDPALFFTDIRQAWRMRTNLARQRRPGFKMAPPTHQICKGWRHADLWEPCPFQTVIGMTTACLINSRPEATFSASCDYCATVRSLLFEHRREVSINPRQGIARNTKKKRTGFGAAATNPRELRELLLGNPDKLTLSQRSKEFFDFPDKSKIFFIDTEFAMMRKDQPNVLLELAIVDWSGKTIFDSKIDYGMRVDQFFERYCIDEHDYFRFSSIAKVIGKPSENRMTGTPIEDLAAKLTELGIGRDSLIIEWSISYCNWAWLSTIFDMAEMRHYAPLKSMVWRPLIEWQRVMPGLRSHRLDSIFPLFFPGHELVKRNHRALPDTQMTRLMTMELFELADKARNEGEK